MADESRRPTMREIALARRALKEGTQAITPVSVVAVFAWIAGPLLLIDSEFLNLNPMLRPLLAVAASTACWYGLLLLYAFARARRASRLLAELRNEPDRVESISAKEHRPRGK